ncbi:MAG TPA: biotin/lipoyl-containing protein, partial [Steroidobacteraceae bacterium]|nr:biotin/lipoyl-containing protein [Steroidobacteraceae bacterium]
MASREIQVPDLGGFKDVAIIYVLVKAGDRVEVDTPLLTLETEKATMDVPSPVAGVIERLLVQKGGLVSTGTPFAVLTVAEGAGAAAPASAAPKAAAVAPAAAPAPAAPVPIAVPVLSPAVASVMPGPVNEAGFAAAHASPGVRRFARELGVDLSRVRGTGQKGRILEADVKTYVKALLGAGGGVPIGGGASPAAALSGLPRIVLPD